MKRVNVKSVTPHLVVRDAAEAIAFYQKAFGAVEIRKSPTPDGEKLMFAEIAIGEGRVYLNDEFRNGVYSLRWRRRARRLPCICLWTTLTPPTSVRSPLAAK